MTKNSGNIVENGNIYIIILFQIATGSQETLLFILKVKKPLEIVIQNTQMNGKHI